MANKKITYAQIADKLSKKIGALEEDMKSSDKATRNTAKLMLPRLKEKLDKLYNHQEQSKIDSYNKEHQKLMQKFELGGDVKDNDKFKFKKGEQMTESEKQKYSDKFANKSYHFDPTSTMQNPPGYEYNTVPEMYFTIGDRFRNVFRPNYNRISQKKGTSIFAEGGMIDGQYPQPTFESVKAKYPDFTDQEIQNILDNELNLWSQNENLIFSQNNANGITDVYRESSYSPRTSNNGSNMLTSKEWSTFSPATQDNLQEQQPEYSIDNTQQGLMQNNQQDKSKGFQDYLGMAATYAPTIWNAYQGMRKPDLTKKGTYYNPYEDAVMKEMRSREFNINPNIEENRRDYNAMQKNIASASGGNSASYLSIIGNAQLAKQRANAALYGNKQNIENQYKAQNAQMLGQFGQQRVQADQYTDAINQQAMAAKRAYQGAAVTGLSQAAQNEQRLNNLRESDMIRARTLQNLYGDYGYTIGDNNMPTGDLYYKG